MLATRDDGTQILLNEDGTWIEVQEKISNVGDFDVRKVNWGMNFENVKKTENLEVQDSNPELLAYETTLSGMDMYLIYRFMNNELYNVDYMFLEEHADDGDFIFDFERLKDNLIKKYGKPSKNDRYFTDDLYEDVYEDWGMSLGRGKLSFFTTWNVKNTEISLSLYGDNYDIKFTLSYTGEDYKDILAAEDENQLMDAL